MGSLPKRQKVALNAVCGIILAIIRLFYHKLLTLKTKTVMKIFKLLLYAATVSLLATACGDDSDDDDPIGPGPVEGQCYGFYLLNRGADGEEASLEYFDFSDYTMSQGWWTLKNTAVEYLGDWGVDVVAHEDYVLATFNDSEWMEICTRTGEHLNFVEIPSCRRIVASEGFAYVSSYADVTKAPIRNGHVAKVDIEKGLVTEVCSVGRKPEGLAIIGDKLYVLNTGDWTIQESSISVIDLKSFTEIEQVNIGNIYAGGALTVMPDGHSLFINSCNASYTDPGKSVIFDTNTLSVTHEFKQGSKYAAVYKDKLYALDTYYFPMTSSDVVSGFVYDAATDTVFDFPVSSEILETISDPSGLWIHPTEGDVYIADGENNKLFRFDLAGTLKGTYDTGFYPTQLAWDIR